MANIDSSNLPKRLHQSQLIRLFKDIRNQNSDDNRFCFLLGAGASISSEIPSGYDLSSKWYKELQEDDCLDEGEVKEWEDRVGTKLTSDTTAEFYPYLYEKRYSASPQAGYEAFQKLMEDKEPSLGYVILAQILANEKHNFVITTNFDYLIEDAVRLYTGKKPFIAGHETLAEFISSQTARPTIIKVHRDLFLHPFNDNDNTRELKEEWKKALMPVLRNFCLLVIGYGGNDGSLMDYLSAIHPENRKSIYWCVRKGDKLNIKVNLLLKAKDFICDIDGFDNVMYSLNNALAYNIFENVELPDSHIFVTAAKKRVSVLSGKLSELIRKSEEQKQPIPDELQHLAKGANKLLLQIHEENDPTIKEQMYRSAIEKYPDDPYLYDRFAVFLFDRKNIDLGNFYFQKAIEIKPDFSSAYTDWGIALGKIGDIVENTGSEEFYTQACQKFEQAINIKHDDAYAYYNWGVALGKIVVLKERDDAFTIYNMAIEKYAKTVEIKPDYYQAFYNWGIDLVSLAKMNTGAEVDRLFTQAFEKFAKTIEIKPDHYDALNNWATGLGYLASTHKGPLADELISEALEKYARAAEIKPNDYDTWFNWGVMLANLADLKDNQDSDSLYRQAFEKYKVATEINPNNHAAYNNWGIALANFALKNADSEANLIYKSALEKLAISIAKGGETYVAACINAILGNNSDAFELLNTALVNKEISTDVVLDSGYWDNLKDNLNFIQLIQEHSGLQ